MANCDWIKRFLYTNPGRAVLALILGIVVSSSCFLLVRFTGWSPAGGSCRSLILRNFIQRDVESTIEVPTRDLQSMALRFAMWVTLPKEALERSLKLASMRQPVLKNLLVANAQGRVLASFSPAQPLGKETELSGSLDPHDGRRLAVTQKKRNIFLFTRKGDHLKSLLLAFPIFGDPISQNALQGDDTFNGVPGKVPAGTPASDNQKKHLVSPIRGYVAATLPLKHLLTRLKRIDEQTTISKLKLVTKEGLVIYPATPLSKKQKKLVLERSGKPVFSVTIRPSRTGSFVLWIILPGLLASVLFFLTCLLVLKNSKNLSNV